MLGYNSCYYNLFELFQDTISKSDGSETDMLAKLDLHRLSRICTVEFYEQWRDHHSLIKKLQYSHNWRHEVHKEILNGRPRANQKGVVYFDKGDVIASMGDLHFCSALITIPHQKYLFIKCEFNAKNMCVHKLYCSRVERLDDDVFQLNISEGRVDIVYNQLMEFE